MVGPHSENKGGNTMSRNQIGIARALVFPIVALAAACGGPAPADDTTVAGDTAPPPTAASAAEAEYQAYMDRAGLALSEGRTQDALDAYLGAAAVGDKTGEITVERAEAHYLAGDMAYQRMDKDLALEQYQEAVDIYLRFTGNSKIKAAVVLTNMGVIYKEKVMKDKARNCWETAVQLYKEAPPELQDHANMRKIEQNLRDLESGF
jgi:tetratricopeptide (TPR) repeat protein